MRAVKIAWAENPVLAVHLISRFDNNRLRDLVRWQVLNFPQRVIHDADALEVLLGTSLPNDVSFQLKVSSLRRPTLFLAHAGIVVSALLGASQPNLRGQLLLASIWQSSVHYPVCYAGA